MLGVELLVAEVRTPQELTAVVTTLPADVQAIFLVPMPSVAPTISDIAAVASARGLPIGGFGQEYAEQGALVSYAPDFFAMGTQAARLADRIFKGERPADLPVETSEYFLTINLKSAAAVGLTVSDPMLQHAHKVIR